MRNFNLEERRERALVKSDNLQGRRKVKRNSYIRCAPAAAAGVTWIARRSSMHPPVAVEVKQHGRRCGDGHPPREARALGELDVSDGEEDRSGA